MKKSKILLLSLLSLFSLASCSNKKTNSVPSQNSPSALPSSSKDSQASQKEHYSDTYYTDGMEFELNENKDGYIVSAYLSPETQITIPELYNNLPVREIKESAFEYLQIDKLTLPKSLRIIHKNAFRGMYADSELKELILPEGLENIEEGAFDDCANLETVSLPSTLKEIGKDSFHLCTALKRFVMEKESAYYKVERSILYTKDGKELVYYPTALTNTTYDIPNGVVRLNDYAIYGNMSLTSVSLPSTIKEIGYRGLAALKNMTSLNLNRAANLEILKDLSLSENESLTSIALPSSIKEFGNGVFKNDKALVSVKLPFSYTRLPDSTFENCGKLTSFGNLPTNLEAIGGSAFKSCMSLTRIQIPSTVKEIGSYAFDNCQGLTSLTLPNGLAAFKEGLFNNCQNLSGINLPSNLAEVGDRVFRNCYSLTSFDSSSTKIEVIGESAFYNCSSLEVVRFPNTLRTIKKNAFESCAKLSPIAFNDGIETIEEYAFAEFVNLSKVYLPKSIRKIGTMAFCSTTKEAKTIQICFEADTFENEYGNDTMFHYSDSRSSVHYSMTRGQYEVL